MQDKLAIAYQDRAFDQVLRIGKAVSNLTRLKIIFILDQGSKSVEEISKAMANESLRIPEDFDYDTVRGLSFEVRQKLKLQRPETIGQASRISGVTPAAVTLLLVFLKKRGIYGKN